MRALVLLLVLLPQLIWAEEIRLNRDTDRQSLNQHVYYMEDPDHTLSLNDAIHLDAHQWQRNHQQTFNQGYSASTWWLRIALHNENNLNIQRLLEISYPVLDLVNIYVVRKYHTDEFQLGDKVDFNLRPVQHRNLVIPLQLKPSEKLELYIQVRSSSAIQVPLTVWEPEAFSYFYQNQNIIHGLYFGIMTVMVVYNLFIFFAVRERSYLYYVMFVCCTPLFLASLTGFSFQFLWPTATQWNDQVIIISLSGVVFFGILFTWEFLKLKQQRLFIKTAGLLIIFSALVTAVLSFFTPYSTSIRIIIPLATLACIYGISIGYYRWHRGDKSAKYYAIAWTAFLVGGIAMALNKYTLLPQNVFTEYATHIGSALEAILLSFALADRISQERQMRSIAQEESLLAERELRHTREQALEIQKQATETLEQRVLERTEELERLNKKLEELSDTDQLTGLKNRRYLDRILAQEFSRCAKYHHPIALVLLDIDHFKQFNDTYGHLIGDQCLKAVATCVDQGLRWASDCCARYGGEEFCLILPETDMEGALTVAEKIRARVENMTFMADGQNVPVTISLGVTCTTPSNNQNSKALIAQADSALYASKENGRNQVTPFKQPNQHPNIETIDGHQQNHTSKSDS